MAARPNKGAIAVLALMFAGVLWLFAPEKAETALDYSVKVQSQSEGVPSLGSGTVIGHTRTRSGHSITIRSTVLSAAHVVERGDQSHITVTWDDVEIPGRVVPGSMDKERDLVLVEVDAALPISPLFFGGTRSGEPVIAIGNQFAHGLIMSDGRAGPEFAVAETGGVLTLLAISAPSYKGSSGGGIFAWRYGKLGLVGVIRSLPKHSVLVHFFGALIPVDVLVTTITYVTPMDVIDAYLAEHKF